MSFLVMFLEIVFLLFVLWIVLRCCVCLTDASGRCSTMIVLGSGGHTAELLSYVRLLPPAYSPRIYVVASNDNLSDQKASELENTHQNNDFLVEKLPRAREVGQSYFTSIFTTCYASIIATLLVLKHRPRLVLCNGPGTCVPVCLAAWVVHSFMRGSKAVVFVESVCRTRYLSLSGRLLYHLHLALVVVQWPHLVKKYPRATYLGLLS
ncbi:UDP-N-acetylglucosamine transferase subunit ALG14 -like protein [Echinococcus granulosus]|uniref:UDP-N-acetylglucosamine transferase subunit ALG14 n=1 Tax=Echinococcus granulosus TaxID=6210 RepID=A0A068WF41_ECHGR|nr:UDP-N-acetylglucosamine transferase subunit ALG14 -like protein [Echinococcus granulosus]CDS16231.1 UDP N acetylglucosamine transferase subunit [Echinococcus granulosus]